MIRGQRESVAHRLEIYGNRMFPVYKYGCDLSVWFPCCIRSKEQYREHVLQMKEASSVSGGGEILASGICMKCCKFQTNSLERNPSSLVLCCVLLICSNGCASQHAGRCAQSRHHEGREHAGLGQHPGTGSDAPPQHARAERGLSMRPTEERGKCRG